MGGELIHILIWLAIIGIAIVAIWYILNQLPLPEPVKQIIIIVIVVIVAIVAIMFLMQLGGMSGGHLLT